MVPSNPSTQAFSSPPHTGAYSPASPCASPLFIISERPCCLDDNGPVSPGTESLTPPLRIAKLSLSEQAHKASFANSFSNVAITVVASTQIDFDLFLAIVTVLIALQFTDPTLICDGTVPAQSLLYDLTSSRNVSVHSNEV
ncbi:hypothetical protein BFJ68_g8907 [Fusarium oxysporum]|uniref:Uncharacterized protein n=2 Tax=Fusarium oxysporum TaxID=5507 RepID=A0A420QYG8_FUSOX|nr:hypothetical protein BFJ65_g9396 [Fusarium oxysporum f. sp. cepae]RKK40616.1 hypothetical protein BFJ66_g11419 [Fusarium oxysporum f. sp. cepae]RKL09769.1 hypothetical protein BFJ68_g8907 [Fusarium oxysporum]